MGRQRTQFKPGQSGNPKGRPAGIKEALPRNLIKRAIAAKSGDVFALVQEAVLTGLKGKNKGIKDPHRYVELVAKLGKEIGAGAVTDEAPTTVVIEVHQDGGG